MVKRRLEVDKMTAVVSFLCRPCLPWSLISWIAVVVCCDGRPPIWPGARRCTRVGSSLCLAHECRILPYTSARSMPLYELGSRQDCFCFHIAHSCPPLYRCGSRPQMKDFKCTGVYMYMYINIMCIYIYYVYIYTMCIYIYLVNHLPSFFGVIKKNICFFKNRYVFNFQHNYTIR